MSRHIMSWHRPRPVEGLHLQSEEETMNRVIRAKALLAACGSRTVTLRTVEGNFEITPEIAKKLLRGSRAAKRSEVSQLSHSL